MRRFPRALSLLAVVTAACVTINVYFPEAAVKELSEQIEQQVRDQAAEETKQQQPEAQEGSEARQESSGGQAGLLDLMFGVSPAMAQDRVPDPEITNPAIRKIIDSRAGRLATINDLKSRGIVGENNQALLEIRDLEAAQDLRERAEIQRTVRVENADREQLFKEVAAAKNVDLAQLDKIRQTYAETLRANAGAGHWIQLPDGSWTRK